MGEEFNRRKKIQAVEENRHENTIVFKEKFDTRILLSNSYLSILYAQHTTNFHFNDDKKRELATKRLNLHVLHTSPGKTKMNEINVAVFGDLM